MEMTMIRSMCGVTLRERQNICELRRRMDVEEIGDVMTGFVQ